MVFTSSCIYREQSYPLSAFSLLSLASPLANGSGAETSHCESRKPNVRGVRVTAPAQEQGACPNQSWFLAQWQSFTCLLFSLISRLPSAVLHFPPSRRIAIRRFQVRFCAPGRGQPSYTSSGWGWGGGCPCCPCLTGTHSAPAAPAEAGVLLITPSLPTGSLVPLLAGGSVTALRPQTGDDSQHAMRPSKRAGPGAPRRAFASSTVTTPPWPDSPRLDFIICYKMRIFHIVLNRLSAAS